MPHQRTVRRQRPLCVSASLREILLLGLLGVSGLARAEDLIEPVQAKVQARFEAIAAGVDGVLGIVVEDLAGEHRFAVNEDRQFAQASAIKIPILMEVFQQAAAGKLDLAAKHAIDKKYQVAGSGILGELGDGTAAMSVEDLCVLMIVLSDNTATNMLIDVVGKDNVNRTMDAVGCPGTRLRRRMMDTAAAARGEENVSTPAEAAKIMRLLHAGEFVNRETSDRILAILRKEKPGDVKASLPAGVPVAFKPGSVPGVATEWALVELERRPYVVVVMGAYGQGDEFKTAIQEVSKVAHGFFSRLATASKYGAYIDPEQWKRH